MSEPTGLPPAQHEGRDVGVRPLLLGGLAVLTTLCLLVGLTGLLYPTARVARLVRTQVPSYPSPELQPDPSADMAKFRAEQLGQLNGVWWVDRASGTVHQPIGDAMRRLAASGIADWPTSPVTAKPTPQARGVP